MNGATETGFIREKGPFLGSKALKETKHGSREIENMAGAGDSLGYKMMVNVNKREI